MTSAGVFIRESVNQIGFRSHFQGGAHKYVQIIIAIQPTREEGGTERTNKTMIQVHDLQSNSSENITIPN